MKIGNVNKIFTLSNPVEFTTFGGNEKPHIVQYDFLHWTASYVVLRKHI